MGRLCGFALIIALLSFLAALGPAGQVPEKSGNLLPQPEPARQPCFGQVVANPTGHNGYEDYVLAADVMVQPKVREAGDAVNAPPPSLSPLAAKRAWVAAARRALELVRTGNSKPMFDPRRKVDATTLFPEFAGFKQIARLFAAEARVRFADGDTAGATQSIVDCLTFAERFGHFCEIGSLVGIACTAIILAEAESDLRVLSQRDAVTLAIAADSLLQRPTALLDGVRSEAALLASSVDQAIDDVSNRAPDPSEDPDADQTWAKYTAELRGLSPSQRQALKGQVVAGLDSRLMGILATLSGPEQGWTEGEPADQAPTRLTDFIVQICLPVYGQAMNAAARSRTQLRLLRLHGAIISFLWEWHRLPKKLDELQNAAITENPVAGKPFHYQATGASSYELWSDGCGETGKIELKYRRSAGASDGGDGPAVP
jgi:hypothetical protein